MECKNNGQFQEKTEAPLKVKVSSGEVLNLQPFWRTNIHYIVFKLKK